MNSFDTDILIERPMSEGDQIKSAIRELFMTSREGVVYEEKFPLRKKIAGVNGSSEKWLCLCKHDTKRGAVVLWYEDI